MKAVQIHFQCSSKNNMLVTPTDGSDTFRICKENGERYVIFYYTNMDFNANRLYNASFTAGTYEVVLLEKRTKQKQEILFRDIREYQKLLPVKNI